MRNSKYKTEILEFERGLFLYTANDMLVKFLKFSANGKPYRWIATPKPQAEPEKKKRDFLDILFDVFNVAKIEEL